MRRFGVVWRIRGGVRRCCGQRQMVGDECGWDAETDFTTCIIV